MRKIYIILFSLFISALTLAQSNPSCVDFTRVSVDMINNNDFIPDGKFNSARLAQGDVIQMYKPFYKSKTYMIIVSCEDNLPGVTVKIQDMARNTIIESTESSVIHEFEYTPDKNQNLIFSVEVEKSADMPASEKGCVSVVIGYK